MAAKKQEENDGRSGLDAIQEVAKQEVHVVRRRCSGQRRRRLGRSAIALICSFNGRLKIARQNSGLMLPSSLPLGHCLRLL
jgi:hypothetical protein